MPTTLLVVPLDFQTFLRPCILFMLQEYIARSSGFFLTVTIILDHFMYITHSCFNLISLYKLCTLFFHFLARIRKSVFFLFRLTCFCKNG